MNFRSLLVLVVLATLLLSVVSPVDASSRVIVKLRSGSTTSGGGSFLSIIQSLEASNKVSSHAPLFAESRRKASRISTSSGPTFPFELYRIVEVEDEDDLDVVVSEISSADNVEYAEPDHLVELFDTPNDPHLVDQWGISNSGQTYLGIERNEGPYNDRLVTKQGLAGADIHVSASWSGPEPVDSPLVVIIDTGLDTDHPDIISNLWSNPGEIPGNGIDDDRNGLIDDYQGWDFSGDESGFDMEHAGDNDVSDEVGHGTHVAGIVGATHNNGLGVVGVCGTAKIVGLKIFPNAYMSVASRAIVYATEIGGKVMNMSWGSPFRSQFLEEAIRFARSRGTLPVAASGNTGDDAALFPAQSPRVLTVGGTNSMDQVTYFSSYGDWVGLVAPARDILSLRAAGTDLYADALEPDIRIVDSYYYLADGTSMAAPHVCGAAAVLLSYSPGLSPDQLEDILIESSDDIVFPYGNTDTAFVGKDKYSGYGRINVDAAMAMLDGTRARIADPYDREIITADRQITGSAWSETAEDFALEIADSRDLSTWEAISSGVAAIQSGYLGTLSVLGKSGEYVLRLSIGNKMSTTKRVIIAAERNFEITSPNDGETVKWFVTLRGSVVDPDFESYEVMVKADQPGADWEQTFESTKLVADSILCGFSMGPYTPGDYIIRVVLHTSSDELYRDVAVSVEDKLVGSFPQSAPGGATAHFASTVKDIDLDGEPEVIMSSRQGVSVFTHDGDPFCCGWPAQVGVDCIGAPAVWDIDGDSMSEVAFCSEYGLNLLDAFGDPVDSFPKYKHTGAMNGYYPSALYADLDGDNEYEVLWLAEDGNVYAYRANGQSYFASLDGWYTSTEAGYYFGSIVPFLFCVDLEGDGNLEIVGGFESHKHAGAVYVWQAQNGRPRPGHDSPLIAELGKIRGGCIADFNLDGEYEIGVVGRTPADTVFAAILDGDGEFLPGWPKIFEDRYNYTVTYPAAADVDGDDYPDLIFGISELWGAGELYVLKYDGTAYSPNLDMGGEWFAVVDGAVSNPVVGDVSGDGVVDVIVRTGSLLPGSNYERVFAFDIYGELISGWPIYTFAPLNQVLGGTLHTPVITDIDMDGLTDIVCTSDDGNVYVWSVGTQYRPENVPWGQYLHDSRNSGVLPRDSLSTGADDPGVEEIRPAGFELGQNYPNPFNSVTKVDFQLGRTAIVKVEIFNLLGQKVRTLLDRRLDIGVHSLYWDGNDDDGHSVASGVYFYRMQSGDVVQVRKMVKLD